MKVLFVNACLRGEKSRTLALCRHYLKELKAAKPDTEVEELNLEEMEIEVQSGSMIEKRDGFLRAQDFSDPMFDLNRSELAAGARAINVAMATGWEPLTEGSVLRQASLWD